MRREREENEKHAKRMQSHLVCFLERIILFIILEDVERLIQKIIFLNKSS